MATGAMIAIGGPLFNITATISNGASLSAAIPLEALIGVGARLGQIVIPSAWTTANITFQTSFDGTTYNDLYDSSGTEYTVTVGGTSRAIIISIVDLYCIRFLKIRSGTTGTPVSQGADRTLQLVCIR